MRRDLSGSVRVAGEPLVVAALVVEGQSGLVLGMQMAADGTEALAGAFTQALTAPPGIPPVGAPALVVCPPGLAGEVGEALAPLVAPGELPPVRQDGPVPGAEDIFDSLVAHLAGRGPSGDLPEPADWSAAVGAAHRLRAGSPWDRWDTSVPLDVELTGAGEHAGERARYRCSVLGAAGEQRGLVQFAGWAWPAGFEPWGPDRSAVPPDGTLALYLDDPAELPKELVDRARRYGWPADDELVPVFAAIEGGRAVEADRSQVRLLAAGAAAVAAHDQRGLAVLGADRATTGTFDLPDGQVAFSVTVGTDSGPRGTGGRSGSARGRSGTGGGATIDVLLRAFLDEQRQRLSPRTLRSYENVLALLAGCLNSYGHQSLDGAERDRWEEAYEGGDEDAFVHLFGAGEIVANLGEFLGWFMVRKVVAGPGLLRSAGTVTNKLVRWLADRGLVDPADAAATGRAATAAARDLPRAAELSELLWEHGELQGRELAGAAGGGGGEGCFTIERVAPGSLWFEGGRGPVAVPEAASALAEPGWSVTGTLVRHGGRWHLVDVGNVYP